ncbi:MAG: SDR family oxidoreductase [Acidovorax sp.]|nr:SDR family oxidoreductase [Acidovorax sp.]
MSGSRPGPDAPTLVLGSTGLLGSRLMPALSARWETVMHARSSGAKYTADLANSQATTRVLDAVKPGLIVNLAALTSVDACEENPQEAYLANVRAVENVAAWIESRGAWCHLLQISTDQVYDGPGPHAEDDVTLVNTYGFSKYAGELAALSAGATVLRTNFFGRSARPGRESLSDWLAQSLRAGTPIQVFDDVLFSPLSLRTLVEMIVRVAEIRPHGIFNLGAADGMSKADFALAFAAALGVAHPAMTRTSSTASGLLRAKRPLDMRMDSRRIESALGLHMPSLRQEIESTAMEYRDAD